MDLDLDQLAGAVSRRMADVQGESPQRLVAGQVDVILRGPVATAIQPVAGAVFDVLEQATIAETGHPLPSPDHPGVFDPVRADAFCRALVDALCDQGAGRSILFDAPLWPDERLPALDGIALAVEVAFIPRAGDPPRTSRALLAAPPEA